MRLRARLPIEWWSKRLLADEAGIVSRSLRSSRSQSTRTLFAVIARRQKQRLAQFLRGEFGCGRALAILCSHVSLSSNASLHLRKSVLSSMGLPLGGTGPGRLLLLYLSRRCRAR